MHFTVIPLESAWQYAVVSTFCFKPFYFCFFISVPFMTYAVKEIKYKQSRIYKHLWKEKSLGVMSAVRCELQEKKDSEYKGRHLSVKYSYHINLQKPKCNCYHKNILVAPQGYFRNLVNLDQSTVITPGW